jgi:hypothetical protein
LNYDDTLHKDDDEDEHTSLSDECEEDDDDEDQEESDTVVPSHYRPPTTSLTANGKAARDIVSGHFGPRGDFLSLTHFIDQSERETINKDCKISENFYTRIGTIERPLNSTKWNGKERDKEWYKLISNMREMYDCEMAVIYNIVNGNQNTACRHALQLVDLTLDCAANANLERLKLRSGSSVVDLIRHRGEEEILQPTYKRIIADKAKEESELFTLTRGSSSQQPPRLGKWGRMRQGWDSRPSRSGSRGRRAPAQSSSINKGSFSRFPSRHQSTERRASLRGQQVINKTVQSRQSHKPFLAGSKKF